MRRVVSLWLPDFATERLRRHQDAAARARPLALTAPLKGGPRIEAACPAARAAGVVAGLPLGDARALLPGLLTLPAEPDGEAADLSRLAAWCRRWTPWTAVDPAPPGRALWLDVTGCAHLFGGEAALLDEVCSRFARLGVTARAGLADTPGAAWAAAHFAPAGTIVAPGTAGDFLARLPVAALRLPAETVDGLARLGLRRVGDLYALPRAPLAARFGDRVARRLDQALGRAPEPLSPDAERQPPRASLAFAEPIGRAEDIARALDLLLAEMCGRLQRDGLGARRLQLALYRVDGGTARIEVGTSRPLRDPAALRRLFADGRKLEAVDAGFGIECATLEAPAADPLSPEQRDTDGRTAHEDRLALLIDRLTLRLGPGRVVRLAPFPSHLPERAWRPVPAGRTSPRPAEVPAGAPEPPRPLRLFATPEPVEAIAPPPDGPPRAFRRGGRTHALRRAEGPERIGPEWWREEAGFDPDRRTRDYYRVEDAEGRRFWLFREGLPKPGLAPRWFLHGEFA